MHWPKDSCIIQSSFFFFFISYNLSNAHVYTQQYTQAHLCVKCTRTLSLGPTTSQTQFSCKSNNWYVSLFLIELAHLSWLNDPFGFTFFTLLCSKQCLTATFFARMMNLVFMYLLMCLIMRKLLSYFPLR